MVNFTKSSIGRVSKTKGGLAENFFKNYLESLGALVFRINDGQKVHRNTQVRRPQPFDFIICFRKRVFFTDVKTRDNPVVPLSFFISESLKKTSTQRQFDNFKKMYEKGFKKTFFSFVYNNEIKIIKTKEIIEKDEKLIMPRSFNLDDDNIRTIDNYLTNYGKYKIESIEFY